MYFNFVFQRGAKPLDHKDNTIITKGRLANKYFILVLLVSICLNLDQNLLNNSITLYLTHLGGSTGLSGLIGVPFAVCAIFARIIGGYLTDHAGRRVTMAAGCFIFGISVILFGMTGSFVVLFIIRGIHGFGYSIANTPISAATMDVCPPEKQKRASGLFYLPSAVSISISGMISVAFASHGRFTEFYILVGSILIVGGILAIACNYEKLVDFRAQKDKGESKYRGAARFFDSCAIPAAILSVIGCLSTAFVNCFILLYAEERGFSNTGMFFTAAAVVMLCMNLSVDAILRRISEVRALVIAFAVLIFGLAALALTESAAAYFLLGGCYGAFFGLAFPVFYSLALRDALPERRGAASGTVLVANDIGIGLGSAIWGYVLGLVGYRICMLLVAAVLVPGIVYSVLHFGRKKQ